MKLTPVRTAASALAIVLTIAAIILVVGSYGGCARQPTSCVSWHTWVMTPGGETRAGDLRVGDPVMSIRADGMLGVGEVVATRTVTARRILDIHLADGRHLWVTPEHPIAVDARTYVPAGELGVDDTVQTGTGTSRVVSIDSSSTIDRRVVDLTVEPHENFFANGVLVHNKSVVAAPRPEYIPGRYIGIAMGTALELTPDGGLLVVLRPDGAGADTPAGDSVWTVESWALDGYLLRATLRRESQGDWLSARMPEPTATLQARPYTSRTRSMLDGVQLITPSRTLGRGRLVSEELGKRVLGVLDEYAAASPEDD